MSSVIGFRVNDQIRKYDYNALDNSPGPFIVKFTGTTSGGDAACDKTFSAIQEAYFSGKELLLKYIRSDPSGDVIHILQPKIVLTSDGEGLNTVGGFWTEYYNANIVQVIWCHINSTEVVVSMSYN